MASGFVNISSTVAPQTCPNAGVLGVDEIVDEIKYGGFGVRSFGALTKLLTKISCVFRCRQRETPLVKAPVDESAKD